MKIEVATKKDDSKKSKGDLLERLATEFLKTQSYEVIRNLGFAGMELDLLCKFKPNGKEIYVECKAYSKDNLIQSDVIKNLVGIRNIKKYNEAWLITTTELGKDAKALVEDINKGEDSKYYAFFSPDGLINALVDNSTIKSEKVINEVFLKIVKDKNKLRDSIFLVTNYGDFWIKEYLDGGEPIGVICAFANTGDVIEEQKLLDNLSSLNTSFSNLDFNIISTLAKNGGEVIPKKVSVENLKLNQIYLNKINDIGVKLNHPDRENLFLDDVFIYPDLEEIKDEENIKILSSKKLLDINDPYKKCFIFGEEVSGKTSLSFTLQKNINSKNLVSLYVNASEIKKSDYDKFGSLLIKKFEQQYNENPYYVDAFKDILKNNNKAVFLIIDDYDSIGIKRSEAQIDFLRKINQQFENIVIFANKRLEIEAMAKSEMTEILNDFELLRLKELGHVLRDELVQKWITLENTETITDAEFYERKDSITNKINITVGTNFLPTYPLYILTMLQFVDDASKLKLQGSSYAELYRSLITQALASANAKVEDLDFFHTYLSHIAYFCFKHRKKYLTHEEILKIYKDYSEEMDIEKKFDSVHGILIRAKILRNENELYQFNHNYSYYFFVAKYLAENIESKEITEEIKTITNKLYTNEFANIIIFLIHHSKDSFIVNRVLEESVKLFNGVIPYTISSEETNKINNLLQGEIKLSLQEENPKDYRKKELEQKDKTEASFKKKRDDKKEDFDMEKRLDLFENLNLSFKLIEIEGQITKNYYGSLNADKKAEILDEICKLGFRALRMLLEDFGKFQDTLKKDIKEKIGQKKASSEADIDKIVNKILFTFNGGIINLFIKKISDSIASKNLLPSIEKMEKRNQSPATQLINMAVELNFPNGLNKNKILALDKDFKNNYLAKTLLRVLVIEHLYKFYVKYSDKQSICNNLGIDLIQGKKILSNIKKKL